MVVKQSVQIFFFFFSKRSQMNRKENINSRKQKSLKLSENCSTGCWLLYLLKTFHGITSRVSLKVASGKSYVGLIKECSKKNSFFKRFVTFAGRNVSVCLMNLQNCEFDAAVFSPFVVSTVASQNRPGGLDLVIFPLPILCVCVCIHVECK